MSDAALIDHVDAPILIGDPEANAVHINPAFERCFGVRPDHAMGMPLAELFEGGAREAMLQAVAKACAQGTPARTRIREKGIGFAVVISPIVQSGEGVGVVVLLKEEVDGSERLMALCRRLEEPVDEVAMTLEHLLEETGGRRNPGHRAKLEEALRALSRVRKGADEMSAVLIGRSTSMSQEPYDPSRVVRLVADSVSARAEARGVTLQLLAPSQIDGVTGDGSALESVLRNMVEARLVAETPPERITLAVRRLGPEDGEAVLLSVSEKPASGDYEELFAERPIVQETLAGLDAELHASVQPRLGRTAIVRLGAGS